VAAELAFGVAKSGSARNRQALEMFLAPLTILPFDDAAAWVYGDLRAELERRGTPPRHNRCRLLRTQEHGDGDEGINWHVSDNHSRIGQ
jgi:predicted nucleic acid-binding protein